MNPNHFFTEDNEGNEAGASVFFVPFVSFCKNPNRIAP